MIKNFVNRPVLTLVSFLAVIILGLFSLANLPLDLMPNISLPTMSVITAYPGASAEDIENSVTKYVEGAVGTVPNVDRVVSNSSENVSTTTITFKWGTNLDAAAADVREKLDLVRSRLPDDADSPTIFKLDLSMMPVLVYAISADDSYPQLKQITDKKIADVLKRIKGVGNVMTMGGLERQINVDVDRNRLEAYQLSMDQVIAMIKASNLTVPAGSLKTGRMDFSVRVPGEYTSVSQISETMIGSWRGRSIFLKDIAEVTDSFKEQQSITQIGGSPALMLAVQKQSGANTVNVARSAMAEMKNIQKTLPADVKVTTILDGSLFINRSISNLTSTLFWGLLFVILVVLFFLQNLRGALIIGLTIPFSLIAAFIYLYFSGSSINMLSLSSLVIAIGMVVDNAVVVLENIYRHRDEKNEQPKEASIFGAGEVSSAIISSTLTTVIVFLPIIMVPGFSAILFKELSYTITIVLSASLFTALTFTPMIASKIMDVKKIEVQGNGGRGLIGKLKSRIEGWLNAVDELYAASLRWALSNRRKFITISSLLFVLSLGLFFVTGTEFIPDMDQGDIMGTVELPVGTRWEETAKVMEEVERITKENVPEAEHLMISAGRSGTGGMLLGTKSGSNYGMIRGRLVPKDRRKRSTKDIQNYLTKRVLQIPGVKAVDFMGSEAMGQMLGMGKPISVEIYGNDMEETDRIAEKLKAKMLKIPGIVSPAISREKNNPELWSYVDRAKASAMGLTMAEIGSTLRNSIYGNEVTKYREAGEEYSVFVRLKEDNRRTVEDMDAISITSRAGGRIALSNIAQTKKETGPLTIQRKNQQRIVIVDGGLYKRPLSDVVSDIRKEIRNITVPASVYIKIAGSAEQTDDTFRSLGIALLLGIILVYLVMAAQFESFLDPFIVAFSIPFALIGVIWAMFLTGNAFGVMPFIGMIMVVGIVVNNAIVLVDYTNILRARGKEMTEAVIEAGRSRLRPILITTTTTLFALLPLAVSRGEGAEMWSPLGIAIIGGLSMSTAVTLIFVPVMYYIFNQKIRERLNSGKAGIS